jgi:hypothetical protein
MSVGVRGPYDLRELRHLAETNVITRDTEAAPTLEGPWCLLRTVAERTVIFPPLPQLALKRPEISSTPDNPAPLHLQQIIDSAVMPGRVLLSRDELEAIVYRPPPAPSAPNEVQEMVRAVEAKEAMFAPPPKPAPRKKISRRLKIVLGLAALGNAVIAAVPIAYHALGDEWSMLVIRAWAIMYNGALVIVYTTLPKD